MNLQALGVKLSRYREQLTETLDEVAEATGVDSERLRSIEAGQVEPSGDEIFVLANVLFPQPPDPLCGHCVVAQSAPEAHG